MTARSSYLGLVALLCACAGAPKQVANVARSDLGCDQVQVTRVADNRYVGSGCGQVRTYAQLCGDGGCTWVRLRGPEEQAESAGGVAASPSATPPPREIIQAPPPQQREIIQAPPPAQAAPREIIPAPPPASATDAQGTQSGGAAPPADASTTTPQSFTPQATPLSQGELSTPYQTEVPVEPVVQRVEVAPPVQLVEERPLPPAPNYVWVSGYWWWNTPRWVWVTGYWCPPRRGYAYVPGSWYWSNNYWWYGPGGWARPGSTYIAYRLPPRQHRVIVTRNFSPHRATAIAPPPLRGSGYGLSRAPSRATSPGSAPRSFTPQGSSLYRYPSRVGPAHSSSPSRSPAVGTPGSSYPRALSPAPAPRRYPGGLQSGGRSPSSTRSFSSPATSPSPRSMPSRGSSFSSGGAGSRGSAAPLRSPSRAPSSVPRGANLRGR